MGGWDAGLSVCNDDDDDAIVPFATGELYGYSCPSQGRRHHLAEWTWKSEAESHRRSQCCTENSSGLAAELWHKGDANNGICRLFLRFLRLFVTPIQFKKLNVMLSIKELVSTILNGTDLLEDWSNIVYSREVYEISILVWDAEKRLWHHQKLDMKCCN